MFEASTLAIEGFRRYFLPYLGLLWIFALTYGH
jgi:hypothetical protein